jgi:hypothetical protein
MKIVKWTLTITVIKWMDQDIPAGHCGQNPSAQSGPIAQFLNGMPDWMNMTPEDINLAVGSLPNPPGISLQEAIEVN